MVAFLVLTSVVLHGVTASPVIARLDRLRLHRARAAGRERSPMRPRWRGSGCRAGAGAVRGPTAVAGVRRS
ncbi:hypothetical protein GCM10009601_08220 [Streptomyces thermospinosisporus]|uniref:Uncharacterized protein n=1 Tax=Streptomyces thermospinosisporus TaxID=161482 RepID=A0ABN1YM64_9ACTN